MSAISIENLNIFYQDLILNKNNARNEILSGKVNIENLPIPNALSASTSYSKIPISKTLYKGRLVSLNKYGFNNSVDYYFKESKEKPIYGHVFNDSIPKVSLLEVLTKKLAEMNNTLCKFYEVEFEPMNGFRPLEVQKNIFQDFYNNGVEKFKYEFHGKELEDKSIEHALKYASKPPANVTLEDSTTWYAHGTGAAIDMLLRDKNGKRLDFGVMFDCPDSISTTNAFENSKLNNKVKKNRRKLFWIMATAGFINYPEEFFHFDPFMVEGRTTQFAILNAKSWKFKETAKLKATVPVAKEAITSNNLLANKLSFATCIESDKFYPLSI